MKFNPGFTVRTAINSMVGVVAGLALLAPSASAAEGTVTGGDADWGVKESFRDYVEGPIATGEIKTSEGATRSGDGTFDFTPASGTYDPTADTANAKFKGSVLFTGHGGILKFRLTDPRVTYTGDTGILYADVVSNDSNGQSKNYPNVDFATLNLTEKDPVDNGSTATLTGIPATLTANGAQAFAGFYDAGEELDPITFSIKYENRPPDTDPPTDPPPSGSLGKLTAGPKSQVVSKKRLEVTLAEVECLAATCKLSADPGRIEAEISGGENAGKKLKVAVKAPSSLSEGEVATVTANLKKKSLKKLGEKGKLQLATDLELTSGGDSIVESVKVKIKAGGSGNRN